jgi:hypothetical protein
VRKPCDAERVVDWISSHPNCPDIDVVLLGVHNVAGMTTEQRRAYPPLALPEKQPPYLVILYDANFRGDAETTRRWVKETFGDLEGDQIAALDRIERAIPKTHASFVFVQPLD